MRLINLVRAGDRVTIMNRFGQKRTGRAVMPCIAGGWVLNMGGAHGTPAIANDDNVVRVTTGQRRRDTARRKLERQEALDRQNAAWDDAEENGYIDSETGQRVL